MEDLDHLLVPYFAYESEAEWEFHARAWAAVPKLTAESYYHPIDPNATCQRSSWGAPQRDPDGSPSVTSKVNEWCASIDGKIVGGDILSEMVPYSYYSYWLSAGRLNNEQSRNICSDKSKISKDECVGSLISAMISCNPNSGTTNGASRNGKCIQYVCTRTLFPSTMRTLI